MHISLDSALGQQRRLNQVGETINSIAASAAATVRISIVNICPIISPEKTEKEIKLMFTASKINSTDIKITIMFFLFKKTTLIAMLLLLIQFLKLLLLGIRELPKQMASLYKTIVVINSLKQEVLILDYIM